MDKAYLKPTIPIILKCKMGASGASWCDFIVHTKKGISVERIPFDASY